MRRQQQTVSQCSLDLCLAQDLPRLKMLAAAYCRLLPLAAENQRHRMGSHLLRASDYRVLTLTAGVPLRPASDNSRFASVLLSETAVCFFSCNSDSYLYLCRWFEKQE